MRLFRRVRRADRSLDAAAPRRQAARRLWRPEPAEAAWMLVGSYLTDGRSLFRVQHAITEAACEDPLLELEDCRTLELTLCSRGALEELCLRTVSPVAARRSAAAGVAATRPVGGPKGRDPQLRSRPGRQSASRVDFRAGARQLGGGG